MARTRAGEKILTAAETLSRAELHNIVINLIDNEYLSMEEIEEGLTSVREKRYIEQLIMEAMDVIPMHKFREFVSQLIQSNHHYQKWLAHEWRRTFTGLEGKYEGDPDEGDPYALIVFMDEESPANLRMILNGMVCDSTPIRDFFKNELLITNEEGTLELREFDQDPSLED